MSNYFVQDNLAGLKREDFIGTVQGKKTDLFILKNKKGSEIAVTNYAGALLAVMMPDRNGRMESVVWGHDSLQHVMDSEETFLSVLIGRYGNRIAAGKFTLDGKQYSLAINNDPNSLHGGPTGFDAEQTDQQTLRLHYLCKDGEEGFPGNLDVNVTYRLTDDNELAIEYEATKVVFMGIDTNRIEMPAGKGECFGKNTPVITVPADAVNGAVRAHPVPAAVDESIGRLFFPGQEEYAEYAFGILHHIQFAPGNVRRERFPRRVSVDPLGGVAVGMHKVPRVFIQPEDRVPVRRFRGADHNNHLPCQWCAEIIPRGRSKVNRGADKNTPPAKVGGAAGKRHEEALFPAGGMNRPAAASPGGPSVKISAVFCSADLTYHTDGHTWDTEKTGKKIVRARIRKGPCGPNQFRSIREQS